MKNAWIRLVFVLCTLSSLLFVGFGLACILGNDGHVFLMGPRAEESASIFLGFLVFHVVLAIVLHILSFVITGDTDHLECMLQWLVPPLVIAIICFLGGDKVSHGWLTAFAVPCNGLAAFGLVAGTAGFVIGVIYDEQYGKLTGTGPGPRQ